MANTVGKPLKSTDDLVGYVFDNLTNLICHYQPRDKLEVVTTHDVSDEPCLKINSLRFSGHMLNRGQRNRNNRKR
jgi:hypothetical protein